MVVIGSALIVSAVIVIKGALEVVVVDVVVEVVVVVVVVVEVVVVVTVVVVEVPDVVGTKFTSSVLSISVSLSVTSRLELLISTSFSVVLSSSPVSYQSHLRRLQLNMLK